MGVECAQARSATLEKLGGRARKVLAAASPLIYISPHAEHVLTAGATVLVVKLVVALVVDVEVKEEVIVVLAGTGTEVATRLVGTGSAIGYPGRGT